MNDEDLLRQIEAFNADRIRRTLAGEKLPCLSTHGGAGYVAGSRREGDSVICAGCGDRVEYVEGRGL